MKETNRYMEIRVPSFRVNGLFYAPKWRILISLDPLLIIFLKLRTVKGAKRYMELILMVFSEKKFTWDK